MASITAKNCIREIRKTSYFENIFLVSLPRKSFSGVTQEIDSQNKMFFVALKGSGHYW